MKSYSANLIDGIEDNIVSLGRYDAMSELKKKVNGYRRFWKRVYIGVTCNPQQRWTKHISNDWRKMVLLYEAYRPDIAISMERELISYARGCGFIIDIENVNPGGEGLSCEQKSNYLYVLVGN
jgi:hypothetical protein